MIKNVFDTALPKQWTERLEQECGYSVNEAHFDKVCTILFKAVSDMLAFKATANKPAAFIIDRFGRINAVAVRKFYEDENNQTAKGNWSLIWSYDEEDIPEDADRLYLSDNSTHSTFQAIGTKRYGMTFASDGDLISVINITIEEIKKYLDENAKEGEKIGVEVTGVFQSRVTIENGVKEFAIEPVGEMKVDAKNDAELEK